MYARLMNLKLIREKIHLFVIEVILMIDSDSIDSIHSFPMILIRREVVVIFLIIEQ